MNNVIFDANANYHEQCDTCWTYSIGIRRAVTNIDENSEWYLNVFESTITNKNIQLIKDTFTDYNNNIGKYAHLHVQDKTCSVAVSFFERDNELDGLNDNC